MPTIETLANAAEATIKGYELEFQALLGAGFSIDGGLARQKPEYTDYTVFDPETGGLVDLTGTPVNTQPENTFTGNVNWMTELGNGSEFSARVGLYWQDETDTGITTAEQIAAGSYTNDSEAIRDLIRREQERSFEIETIRQALIEGEASGEPEQFDFAAFKQRKAAQHG